MAARLELNDNEITELVVAVSNHLCSIAALNAEQLARYGQADVDIIDSLGAATSLATKVTDGLERIHDEDEATENEAGEQDKVTEA